MERNFEDMLDLFFLGADTPTPEEAVQMAKLIFEYRKKISELESLLTDREQFIEQELQKGMAILKAHIISGLNL
jgi:hypothetical protein